MHSKARANIEYRRYLGKVALIKIAIRSKIARNIEHPYSTINVNLEYLRILSFAIFFSL